MNHRFTKATPWLAHLLTSLAIISLSACSVPRSVKEGGTIPGQQVIPAKKVLVLAIKDGQEQGQPPAVGSGAGLAAALRKALVGHNIPVAITADSTVEQGFADAARNDSAYVMQATITHWEDNATAWSGKGDQLFVSVELYDANSHELVAAATHKRTATGATFVSGTPDRFMDEVSVGALGKIYGWPVPK
jgi:hypothetical protein